MRGARERTHSNFELGVHETRRKMPQILTKSPYDSPESPAAVEASTGAPASTGAARTGAAGTGAEPDTDDSSPEPGKDGHGPGQRGHGPEHGPEHEARSRTRLLDTGSDPAEEEEPEKGPAQGSLASSSDGPPEGSRVPLDSEQRLRPGGSAERTKTERASPGSVAPDTSAEGPPGPAEQDSLCLVLEQKRPVAPLNYSCCWDLCGLPFPSSPDLADHLRDGHVDVQRGGVFVCLWKGCKVYNTPSTSQSWLQRHMLSHSGDKPFKCLVGGCTATFSSQGGLARHVPTHFSDHSSSRVPGHSRAKDESPSKAGLKRRKARSRQRRSLPRPHDFFDAQTMDAIRHRAICLNLATHIESLGSGHSVVFHSTVIARRKEESGKVKVLLHWTPEDILPDVWVNESERLQQKTRVVHLSKLPTDTAVLLDPNIYRMFF
ncbi:zinc finger protein aebp2-like isoform X2 [Eucyclogobius newberryi]|uniref:zinc finger protein aebp2-like isoform X2 n=1 Tax=Eucyclogobius newberryi TaxID=166745 RepID=UPI003B5B44EA